MRIHILGICGTFMGGLAAIAKAAGHEVSGSDENVYPPMSEQLSDLGIHLQEGYNSVFVSKGVDCVVVGNGLSRGNVAVEALLNSDLPYCSGPQWLFENVLQDKWVLAVAGTHGKTTTSSMLAWILDYAKCAPGFLIGGVPHNFGISARLGESDFLLSRLMSTIRLSSISVRNLFTTDLTLSPLQTSNMIMLIFTLI